jgi:hypothetical protein
VNSRSFACWRPGVRWMKLPSRLFLSAKTVANYQTGIRQKTGLATTLDMYRHAEAHKLLDGSE